MNGNDSFRSWLFGSWDSKTPISDNETAFATHQITGSMGVSRDESETIHRTPVNSLLFGKAI
jgi:hypothetical protein